MSHSCDHHSHHAHSIDIQAIEDIIKSAGLKLTQPRVEVLSVLCSSEKPLSADEILSSIEHKSPDRATVYRVLSSFEELKIIRPVRLSDGVVRYEKQEGDHHHHHAVCTDCGKIEIIANESLEQALVQATKSIGMFKNTDSAFHNLEFSGVCEDCAEEHDQGLTDDKK